MKRIIFIIIILIFGSAFSLPVLAAESGNNYQDKLNVYSESQKKYQALLDLGDKADSSELMEKGKLWLISAADLFEAYLVSLKEQVNEEKNFSQEQKNNLILLIDSKNEQIKNIKISLDSISDPVQLQSKISELKDGWEGTSNIVKMVNADLFLNRLKDLATRIKALKEMMVAENNQIPDSFSEKKEVLIFFEEFDQKLKVFEEKNQSAANSINSMLQDEANALVLFSQAKADLLDSEIALKQGLKILKNSLIKLKAGIERNQNL